MSEVSEVMLEGGARVLIGDSAAAEKLVSQAMDSVD